MLTCCFEFEVIPELSFSGFVSHYTLTIHFLKFANFMLSVRNIPYLLSQTT